MGSLDEAVGRGWVKGREGDQVGVVLEGSLAHDPGEAGVEADVEPDVLGFGEDSDSFGSGGDFVRFFTERLAFEIGLLEAVLVDEDGGVVRFGSVVVVVGGDDGPTVW